MDVVQLKIVAAVNVHGSFVGAARALKKDPSTVSRAVASIEHELGTKLFDRTTRKIVATDAGSQFCERAVEALDILDAAIDAASCSGYAARGNIRLVAPVSFAQQNIVPLLSGFKKLYPDDTFELRLTDRQVDLVEFGANLAIRIGRQSDSSYITRRLCSMRMHACASPDYLNENGRPASPSDLIAHQSILLDLPDYPTSWTFLRDGREPITVALKGHFTSSNAMALKQLALDGAGVAVLADWTAGRELASGALIDLFPDHEVTGDNLNTKAWLVLPRKDYVPARVRLFSEFLIKSFSRGAPWNVHADRVVEDKVLAI